MTRLIPALMIIALLAACGVEGPPTRPEQRPAAGASLSGNVEIGVTGGS
ncbi:MAG: argininosuccinate lyase [Rhodobacteraceae bacterium CG17_big_fil_post_rev_8_21_14_2_50_65_11]|nr:MAG: argininosuccinate lyase [Rhodobacteraceae bacterium CG17_big_fil_post_rev_8_21_14_2_50_65_11]